MWLRTEWRRCLYDGMLFRRSREYWQTWSFNMINIDMVLHFICFREIQPKLAPLIKCIIVIVVNFNMVNFYHHSKCTLLIHTCTIDDTWNIIYIYPVKPFSAFIPLQLHSAFDQCIQLSLYQCLEYNWIHSPVITPYLYQCDS